MRDIRRDNSDFKDYIELSLPMRHKTRNGLAQTSDQSGS